MALYYNQSSMKTELTEWNIHMILLEWRIGCGQASPMVAAYQKKVQESSNFSGHKTDVSVDLQYILETWRSKL